jgi:putative Mg2+ transporter-C (MgtC) family protein
MIDVPDSAWEVGGRIGVALALGAVIGLERETAGQPAGLRTFMMVSLGAAAFTLVGLEFLAGVEGEELPGDPTRLVAGLMTGVGFLGAGAIIQAGGKVKGLTTAAGVWVSASIGLASGAGAFALAGMVAGAGLVILLFVRPIERLALDTKGKRGAKQGSSDDEPA